MKTESLQKTRRCDCDGAPRRVLLFGESGQAAHDSARTAICISVSRAASAHLVDKSNLQNLRPGFPKQSFLVTPLLIGSLGSPSRISTLPAGLKRPPSRSTLRQVCNVK